MCFNLRGNISTLNGDSQKVVDKFTYHGSSVLSTENDINARLAKIWTAIDRLSVIRKSYLSDRIKGVFSQVVFVSILLYGCTIRTLTKCIENKLNANSRRMLRALLNKSREQHTWKQQVYSHLPPNSKSSKLDKQDMWVIAGGVRTTS